MKKKTQAVKKDMVRAEVRNLVHGPSYMTFEDAIADFPMKHINTRPPNIAYSPWHLLRAHAVGAAGHPRLHPGPRLSRAEVA